MKRLAAVLLLTTGLLLVVTAALVLSQDGVDPERLEFIGSRDCRDCHRGQYSALASTAHGNTMVAVEADMDAEDNPVVADFSVGAEQRTATFADGERAFGLEDVAYTLGVGRHKQAYIHVDEAGTPWVLPAEWNVMTGEWETLALAESWPDEAFAYGPNCAYCHTVGLDTSDYTWQEESVTCEACHGPGLTHVEAADDAGGSIDEEELAAIRGSITIGYAADTCGQCHVRGLASDGVHPYPVGFYPGLVELADVYTPFPPDDAAHWWATGHASMPNMQHNEWLQSSHGDGLVAAQESEHFEAACLTCHSVTQQLVDLRLENDEDPDAVDPLALAAANPYGVTCASCHDAHPQVEDGAAMPAAQLLAEPYALCVSCHADNEVTGVIHHPVQQVFEGTTLIDEVPGVPGAHFIAEDGPTCTTCHMAAVDTYNGVRHSHTFGIIAPGAAIGLDGLQDSCSGCHSETPEQLQQLIDDIQADMRARIDAANAAITDDTPAWVRDAMRIVDGEGSAGIHNYAYSDALLDKVGIELGLYDAGAE
jgi:hypothetical protein